MTRAERRANAKKIAKRRLRFYSAAAIFGLGKREKAQPNRMAKTKIKFTHQHASLKKDKQLAARAARKAAKLALKAGRDPQPPGKASVRWNYW